MCGHATISLGRYAVDYGVVPAISPETSLTIQCPCGPLKVNVEYSNGKTGSVSFESVPSYVVSTDQQVTVPSVGTVTYDLAYGGAYYAFVDARSIGLDLKKTPVKQCVESAGAITDELRKILKLSRPDNPDLAFLYGTILTAGGEEDGKATQLCIFAERQVREQIRLLMASFSALTYPSIQLNHPSINLSIHLFIHPSIYSSIHLFIIQQLYSGG